MGGTGSGREAEVYSGTVEQSLQIDVNKLVREGAVRPDCQANGILSWEGFLGQTSSLGYEVQCYGENGHIRLMYTVSSLFMESQAVNYAVELYTTKPYFGGIRWWFICPNPDCDRMVVKLYQPPGATYFLCRTCQKLTYQSCRESGKSNPFFEAIAKETGLSVKEAKKTWKQHVSKQNTH